MQLVADHNTQFHLHSSRWKCNRREAMHNNSITYEYKQFEAEYMRTDDIRKIGDDKATNDERRTHFEWVKLLFTFECRPSVFQFVHKRIGMPCMLTTILKYETDNDLTKLFRIDSGKPSDYGHFIH